MTTSRIETVIMAGGWGTRFWPWSRRSLPKQFLRIGSDRTLLRETFERVAAIGGSRAVSVAVSRDHLSRVRRELPEIPGENFFPEPVGRDTAPCIGFAAEVLRSRGAGEAVMVICPSDHVIRPESRFLEAIRTAATIAREGRDLVTFGIPPRGPSTAFGYIQRGDAIEAGGSSPVYRALKFEEKPDRNRAEEFLRRGCFYWNSGIFVWRVDAIRKALSRFLPVLFQGLASMARPLDAGTAPAEILSEGFESLPKGSIDRGVLEKAALEGQVAVVEAAFEWDDVGSWSALERHFPDDGMGNHVRGRHLGIDTKGCIVAGSGRRLIATIGLRDMVIVETDDAILVSRLDQVEKVKELVEELERRGEAGAI